MVWAGLLSLPLGGLIYNECTKQAGPSIDFHKIFNNFLRWGAGICDLGYLVYSNMKIKMMISDCSADCIIPTKFLLISKVTLISPAYFKYNYKKLQVAKFTF